MIDIRLAVRSSLQLLAALALCASGSTVLPGVAGAGADASYMQNNADSVNPTGIARTFSTNGPIRFANPFFLSLGTNGRTCASCHVPQDGWSLVPANVRQRFDATDGEDTVFRAIDGAMSPFADVSSLEARRSAYAMLLSRGVIRMGFPIPPGAEFVLQSVDDPYRFASAAELSLFRRPLPTTNLKFLTTVMWDGRETHDGLTMEENLALQADGATSRHAEATRSLTADERTAMVTLQIGLFQVQRRDMVVGTLPVAPDALSKQPFFPGINSGSQFDFGVFRLFDRWVRAPEAPRIGIARGQRIFNTRPLGTSGFTCSTCHNMPEIGNNSEGKFFDTGVAAAEVRTPDMPLYTLRCASGQIVRTTDPGRAMVTGRCADINLFKVPVLRGLAARAPYFHNGSAATVEDVVSHYERHFGIGLTPSETVDLVTFIRSL